MVKNWFNNIPYLEFIFFENKIHSVFDITNGVRFKLMDYYFGFDEIDRRDFSSYLFKEYNCKVSDLLVTPSQISYQIKHYLGMLPDNLEYNNEDYENTIIHSKFYNDENAYVTVIDCKKLNTPIGICMYYI